MSRFIPILIASFAFACGSTKVVWTEGDAEDSLFPFDGMDEDTPLITPDDINSKDASEAVEEVIYSTAALLEYYEPYGDNNVQCQGFVDPPANTKKIATCDFEMSFNQIRAFKVQFFVEGQPFQSQQIDWELTGHKDDQNNPIISVDTLSSGTDADGIATLKVQTKDIAGEFVIKANAVSQYYTAKPLEFKVKIQPKMVEPLTIKLKYEGINTLDNFNVYLFDQYGGEPACLAMDPDSPPFPAAKSQSVASVTQSVKFMSFSELSAQKPKLTFTAIAVGSKANGNAALAFGCNDTEVIVEMGKSRIVTIVLMDIPPKYAGTYEVVNHFDMISALPDDVEKFVETIIDFFNSPTAGLLKLTCQLGGNSLSGLCDTIFATPQEPDIEQLTAVGTIIVQVVNSILYGLLADNIGKDILFTGKDVGNILRDLEIHATLTLFEEPDNTGFLGKEFTEVTWDTVAFQWTLGETCNPADPWCGLKSYSFNAIGQDVVIGNFDMQIDQYAAGKYYGMIVKPYSLNFKYGLFINFVIEKMLLPELAGDGSDGLPVVDSYEKFIKSLLAGKECLVYDNCCTLFVQSIIEQSSPVLQGTLSAGCEALITLGTGYFENWLGGLDASSGDSLTLFTPDGQPCTLYDKNNDHVIDAMGKAEPEAERCMWKTQLMIFGAPVVFDAAFYGNRVQ